MSYFFSAAFFLSIFSYSAAGGDTGSIQVTTANTSHTSCQTWFTYNNITSKCECGSLLGGIISCRDKENFKANSVVIGYCMTYDEEVGTVAGSCSYNLISYNSNSVPHIYRQLPLNNSLLNDEMCGDFKRTRRLCGSCEKGFQLSAYSYNMKCVQCSRSVFMNWMIYMCVAFLPLTGFFIFVLVFRISATSPKWDGYILLAQYMSSPYGVRSFLSALETRPILLTIFKFVMTLYGVWNLDFFRTLYPPICLDIDPFQVIVLDYVVAVYPLVLVILAYVCIQLHAHGCKLLIFLWFPFRKCYIRIQNKVDIKASIIDVFASFLVLSYVKFLASTFDLLIPIKFYNVRGESLGYYIYFDANLKYFGSEHLPYVIIALVIAFFLILPPLLLLLYPLRTFRRFCGNWQALPIFIDSFQGVYKDGVVEGKYDYRYFSAAFLIIRIVLLLTYMLTLNRYFYLVSLFIFMVFALILMIVKPYKEKYSTYLTANIVFLLLVAMWNASIAALTYRDVKAEKSLPFSVILFSVLSMLPLVYIPLLILKELWPKLTLRGKVNFMSPFVRKRSNLSSSFDSPLHRDEANNCEDKQYNTLLQSREVDNYGSLNYSHSSN